MTSKGRVKVLDFGLAQILHPGGDVEATETTPDTDAAGTLPYMAPEVLRGEPADARSDTWSLGVMLYEMLAGKRSFQAETRFALASRIRNSSDWAYRCSSEAACLRLRWQTIAADR